MKRTLALLLVFAMMLSVPLTALATDMNTFTFDLSADGEYANPHNIKVETGTVITVVYRLTVDNAKGAQALTQDEIRFDSDFFQFVEGSITLDSKYGGGMTASLKTRLDGKQYVYFFNAGSKGFSDGVGKNPSIIGTFKLKVIGKSGYGMVESRPDETQEDGMVLEYFGAKTTGNVAYNKKAVDLKVSIGSSSDIDVTGVSLDEHELTLALGGEASLTATVAPDNATDPSVTWASTDESVVTVDQSGNITVVGPGTATITVTTTDGGFTDSCVITVNKNTQTITASDQTVSIGSSLDIVASTNAASDGATLTYAIDGEAPDGVTLVGNVLTVAGTAAEGTVTININSAETTNYAAAQQKQITITISSKTDAGVSITDPGAKTYGDEDFTLDVDVETEGANGEYSYESSNPSVLTVDNEGNVTVVGAGEATITVTYSSDTSFDESSVAVTVAPKALTITGVEATDRDYEEGNTDVELTGGELVGVVGDDDVNFTLGSGTASADEGEDLAVTTNIQLTGGDAGNYTLTQPQDVTVTITKAGPTPCPRDETCPIDPFEDTLNDFWWHDGIHFCLEKRTIKDRETRIMSGFEDGTFQPNGYLTREQIVNMLWNMEGQPQVEYNMTFKDVANDRWSANAIRWAQSENVVSGHSDEEFAPADYVTREQLMSILHRYAKYKEKQGAFTDDLSKFTDTGNIHSWFTDDVQWAVGAGIVHGDAGMLDPLGNTTRAQAAVMIHNFCINILGW